MCLGAVSAFLLLCTPILPKATPHWGLLEKGQEFLSICLCLEWKQVINSLTVNGNRRQWLNLPLSARFSTPENITFYRRQDENKPVGFDVTVPFARLTALKSVERQGWIHKVACKAPYSHSFCVWKLPEKLKSWKPRVQVCKNACLCSRIPLSRYPHISFKNGPWTYVAASSP